MSRADLDRLLHRATGELARRGLRAGDHVATTGPNTRATFALGWALALAGVVEVPVPGDTPPAEAARLLDDARPQVLLTTASDLPAGVADAVDRRDLGAARLDLDGDGPLAMPTAAAPRTRPMSYTSGTTGRRKGVHAGVHDAAWGARWLTDEAAAFGGRHGDRHLVVSPLYHSGPFRHALVTAQSGGTVEVLPEFDTGLWLTALREYRPTSMFCVPTHLHRLLADPGFRPGDLGSLTLLVHAGAPCPVDLKHRLHDAAPDGTVWEFYGSTEGQFTSCPPDVWEAAPGTVGTARPDRSIQVRDDDGAAVPTGEVGTVWTSAPDHARWQYWGLPQATDDAWDDGWFTVDDLGHLDEAGRLVLDGRAGDLVISGGVNVYPAEVESVLREARGVADAAVFGVDDAEWGQRVVALVEPDGDVPVVADVLALARRRLPRASVPRDVTVVDALPRTPTGKVRRTDLEELL